MLKYRRKKMTYLWNQNEFPFYSLGVDKPVIVSAEVKITAGAKTFYVTLEEAIFIRNELDKLLDARLA